MAEDKIRKLEGRIQNLENALASRQRPEPTSLSEDEVAAYIKVRDVIAADYGEFCGINDCFRPIVCRVACVVCRICRICDVECICGPCNIGGLRGGSGDFMRFGG
jgi:hypothetical protein